MKTDRMWFLVAAAVAFSRIGQAEPLPPERVPEPLRPWTEWVLRGHEQETCPFFEGGGERHCLWPAELVLELDAGAGRFTQRWMVFNAAWVPLPGSERQWPEDVQVDGAPASVALQNGAPSVRLEKGSHVVRGAFHWTGLPELLPIPPETGVVSLTLGGHRVDFPRRDPQGQLWLARREVAAPENRVEILVHRRVQDEVPLVLVTRVELRVSGKNREMLVGPTLPDGFVPLALDTPLPARLEPDGHLRVQVRPGTWVVEIRARHTGLVSELSLTAAEPPWAEEEVWVFDARPDLRVVSVEGVPAVDPQQTELPPDWRSLPAYLMRAGSTMKLEQKSRGDSDPQADQLSLRRTWWLDFDGGGYTVQDTISGMLRRSWRLEMPKPAELGRVAIGGVDQFITRLDGGGAGIEIRQGQVQIDADSRLPDGSSTVPAVGWDHDFQQVSGELRLPPGWRLFHASGVDEVSSTWINRWTLLDLFMVLLIAMAIGRLCGRVWGALAMAMLALTYLEPGAPRAIWIAVLAGLGLLSVLPEGRARRAVRLYHLVVLVTLAMIAVPFMVAQMRQALHPALEDLSVGAGEFGLAERKAATEIAPEAPAPLAEPGAVYDLAARGSLERFKSDVSGGADAYQARSLDKSKRIDPNAAIQTGPGLPTWTWRSIGLSWRGPVTPGQTIRLVLIPPALSSILSVLRVAMLALLIYCVGRYTARVREPLPPAATAAAAGVLLLLLFAAPPARADFPPPEILDQLREQLLEKPACFPACASSARMRLEATRDRLRLRLEIDAAASAAIPLPGNANGWTPETVILDGAPAAGMMRAADGLLWIVVSPGRHQAVLDGRLPALDTVDLPLPLPPRRVESVVEGWTVAGVDEDGAVDGNLQLVRVPSADEPKSDELQPGVLPPFVQVERNVSLALTQEVTTRVARLSPPGSSIVVEVPLLAGESVTTAGVRVQSGKALVSLGPQAMEASWHSLLESPRELELRAPDAVPWTEIWRLDVSPMWHADVEGIPMVHRPDAAERTREWRPWPGEQVTVKIRRPAPVSGPTLTIDSTSLEARPGLRASDFTLALSLRSSRGGRHEVELPEGAELLSVVIDGVTQPIRPEGRSVAIPIVPGRRTATLAWREPRGVEPSFGTPAVDVRAPSVNASTQVMMPVDRWVLWLSGGGMGPAVLFWSYLVVIAIVAAALSRVRSTPLRGRHWFLLGLGLTQVPVWSSALIAGWLLALGWRRERGAAADDASFNWMQVVLAIWTFCALAALFSAIEHGLLGLPEMQIAGYGSSAYDLRWYHDRTGPVLPQVKVVSVPLLFYRGAMLAWALWIAWSLLGWLRWGWTAFNEGGFWRSTGWKWRKPRPAPAPAVTPAPTAT